MPHRQTKKPGFRFHSRTIELVRKYAWTAEKRTLLYRYLDLRPNHVVVDVGCGTGAFTRVIAQRIDPKKGGRVIGVDRNAELLKEGSKIANGTGFGNVVSFERGDATRSIPFPDNYADRVVCQAFLWLMTEERRMMALKEMIRVCKPGGLIGACEGALDTSVIYAEGNERFTELSRKFSSAEVKGFMRNYGYDRAIGYKLPVVFKRAGLERVRLDGIAHTYLWSDDRLPLEYKIAIKEDAARYPSEVLGKLDRLPNTKRRREYIKKVEPSRLLGGMTSEEITG